MLSLSNTLLAAIDCCLYGGVGGAEIFSFSFIFVVAAHVKAQAQAQVLIQVEVRLIPPRLELDKQPSTSYGGMTEPEMDVAVFLVGYVFY